MDKKKSRFKWSRIKYYFYPKSWRAYWIHLVRKYLKWMDGSDWTPEIHEIEQYHFRLLSCPVCVRNNKCVAPCECSIPEKMWVRTDTCTVGMWDTFKTKEDWEEYKSMYKVIFKLQFGTTNEIHDH